MKSYRFRKMYFICTDKQVISPNTHMTNAYQFLETANKVCEQNQRHGHKMWEDKTKPAPVDTVEGFYLVPESLFEEMLEKYCKQKKPPIRVDEIKKQEALLEYY